MQQINTTHALRVAAYNEMSFNGATREDGMSVMHHYQTDFDNIYSQYAINWKWVMLTHGFEGSDKYIVGRSLVDISVLWPVQWERIKQLVCPELDRTLEYMISMGQTKPELRDISAEYFLQSLEWMRSVWLQGKLILLYFPFTNKLTNYIYLQDVVFGGPCTRKRAYSTLRLGIDFSEIKTCDIGSKPVLSLW